MSKLIINGGKKLLGEITPVANKNTVIKLIPACLLTDEDVIITNVPMSSDVKYMCQILEKLGGTITIDEENNTLKINCKDIHSYEIDAELSNKVKASVMFLGPLLIRKGKAVMPSPQGCKLGTRPLDALIDNMIEMGASYEHKDGEYFVDAHNGLKATDIRQWFPSVTGTENLIILATKVPGKTIIYNAACEPHTQELCDFLVSMGAKISGIGSNKLEIEGVETLHGTSRNVLSDHLDVGGFIAACAMTGGEITINNAATKHLGIILQVFEKLGVYVDVDYKNDKVFVPKNQPLTIQKTIKGDFFEIMALPWPLYPADLIQIAIVLALKAKGTAIFRNVLYENSLYFVQQLGKMKAQTVLADPTRVVTFGPTTFKSTDIECPDIIQATYGLVLAALSAEGESILNNCDSLFRRYPNLVEQFKILGADIEIHK